jgi:hypothetical protein
LELEATYKNLLEKDHSLNFMNRDKREALSKLCLSGPKALPGSKVK